MKRIKRNTPTVHSPYYTRTLNDEFRHMSFAKDGSIIRVTDYRPFVSINNHQIGIFYLHSKSTRIEGNLVKNRDKLYTNAKRLIHQPAKNVQFLINSFPTIEICG